MSTESNITIWLRPHFWAVLLCCATFPLIWVGGLVTTTEAGMAVPDWPTTYGYNMFLYPWQTWMFGPWDLFIEHGHRLLGSVSGLLSIALCVTLWLYDDRRYARWLGVATLIAVIAQGVLGGLRVQLDQNTLAMIHGCTGPAFFALTAVMATITSRWWREAATQPRGEDHARIMPLGATTSLLAFLQLTLGAQLRHVPVDASPGSFRAMVLLHLMLAVVLALYVGMLVVRTLRAGRGERLLTRPAHRLAMLFTLQLVLGTGAWVLNYQWPQWLGEHAWNAAHTNVQEGLPQVMVTTAHMAVGSLILVNAVLLTIRSARLLRRPAGHSTTAGSIGLGVAV
ncbi:MAG: COX15/CtaA family protein [Planctomycetia bacterium]|nr:COX15/CtaA family protein [Planctomycetia bacterium]